MLLANRSARLQSSSNEKSPRSLQLSPQRAFPRDQQNQTSEQTKGRSQRVLAAAETGIAKPESAVTGQPATLEPTKRLLLRFGAANLPHPDKSDYGGEDAYFTSPVGGGALGVADGVGGWQDSGINPAEYSRTFMRLACAYLEGKVVRPVSASELAKASGGSSRGQAVTPSDASLRDNPPAPEAESTKTLTPQGALTAAHTGTRLPGSSTACVLRLDRTTNRLSAANLGDSGFLLVRNGQAVFRTPALQHFFDCPLQFAAYPDYTSATDTPEDAGVYELPVQPGDMIVAGTDGLWDNVPQEEIIATLPNTGNGLPEAAQNLVKLASKHAHDRKFQSPYSQEAVKQGIDIPWILRLATASFHDGKFRLGHMRGGKVDDVTVVLAYVDEEEYTPPPPPPQPTPSAESSSPDPITAAAGIQPN